MVTRSPFWADRGALCSVLLGVVAGVVAGDCILSKVFSFCSTSCSLENTCSKLPAHVFDSEPVECSVWPLKCPDRLNGELPLSHATEPMDPGGGLEWSWRIWVIEMLSNEELEDIEAGVEASGWLGGWWRSLEEDVHWPRGIVVEAMSVEEQLLEDELSVAWRQRWRSLSSFWASSCFCPSSSSVGSADRSPIGGVKSSAIKWKRFMLQIETLWFQILIYTVAYKVGIILFSDTFLFFIFYLYKSVSHLTRCNEIDQYNFENLYTFSIKNKSHCHNHFTRRSKKYCIPTLWATLYNMFGCYTKALKITQ